MMKSKSSMGQVKSEGGLNTKEKVHAHYKSINKPGALSGLSKLNKHIKISKKVIQKSLLDEPSYTLHTPIRKRFVRRKVITNGPGFQLQMDLIDLSHLKDYNKGFKFLLTVIDVFSKVGHASPLKNKTSEEVLSAVKKVLKNYPNVQYVQTDRGSEFLNRKIQTFFKTVNITHFYTYNDEIKAGIVERFNRTLKMKLWRFFTLSSSYKYIHVLEDIISSYNNTFHRTIGMTPMQVNSRNKEEIWWNIYSESPQRSRNLLNIGDYVRIVMNMRQFQKEATSSWSKEIFKVSSIMQTAPYTYKIQDMNGDMLEGSFYREELQRVQPPITGEYNIERVVRSRGKGKDKEVLVKWEGYPSSFNSWIKASTIQKKK